MNLKLCGNSPGPKALDTYRDPGRPGREAVVSCDEYDQVTASDIVFGNKHHFHTGMNIVLQWIRSEHYQKGNMMGLFLPATHL